MPGKKPLFEHTSCTRCGGSGHYSYCAMHGTTCFKCHGTGYQLTKRGRAAQSYLTSLRKVPAGDLSVGDVMLVHTIHSGYFARIVEIKPHALMEGHINISTEHSRYGSSGLVCFPATLVTKGFSGEEKAAQRQKALDYQATLTKAGTPSKRKSK